jgi:hypothetical protein
MRTKLLVAWCFLAGLGGCGSDAPFEYVPVRGTIKYEDGELIPAESIRLTFDPLVAPLDEKTYPRKGSASVDVATGGFTSVTSYKPGDGLVAGEHKVIVTTLDRDGNVAPLVPREYEQAGTTPLVIHTDDSPLDLRVPRP